MEDVRTIFRQILVVRFHDTKEDQIEDSVGNQVGVGQNKGGDKKFTRQLSWCWPTLFVRNEEQFEQKGWKSCRNSLNHQFGLFSLGPAFFYCCSPRER
ncbi:hypothetical protein EUGRSUZ_K03503 [Eucalyptus grandis]|uniref:Uncharacterized protein n=2 Tax=Eucalyptus grandis TaxID=71139 RepID=A0ACC3IZQ2_EUCGR|nr:hypothetical protein EUGRSUZ_K03503 [Eucalyptus grandis]